MKINKRKSEKRTIITRNVLPKSARVVVNSGEGEAPAAAESTAQTAPAATSAETVGDVRPQILRGEQEGVGETGEADEPERQLLRAERICW